MLGNVPRRERSNPPARKVVSMSDESNDSEEENDAEQDSTQSGRTSDFLLLLGGWPSKLVSLTFPWKR